MMGCQLHQLDHIQIICTLIETYYHSISQFLQAGCSSCFSTSSAKAALKFFWTCVALKLVDDDDDDESTEGS